MRGTCLTRSPACGRLAAVLCAGSILLSGSAQAGEKSEREQLAIILGKILSRQVDVGASAGACYGYFIDTNFIVLPAHCVKPGGQELSWSVYIDEGRARSQRYRALIFYADPNSDIAFAVSRVHPDFKGWLYRKYQGSCPKESRLYYLPRNSRGRLNEARCLGRAADDQLIYFDGDARSGDSGSPVFTEDAAYLGMLVAKAPGKPIDGFGHDRYGVSRGTYVVPADRIFRTFAQTMESARQLPSVSEALRGSISTEELLRQQGSGEASQLRARARQAQLGSLLFGTASALLGGGLGVVGLMTGDAAIGCAGAGCLCGSVVCTAMFELLLSSYFGGLEEG